jgi:hypothetical protein
VENSVVPSSISSKYATNKLPERTTIVLRHRVEVVKSRKSYLTAMTGKPPINEKVVDIPKEAYFKDIQTGLLGQETVKLAQEARIIKEGDISMEDVVGKLTELKLSGDLLHRNPLK